jgi:hypothetical protein
MIKEEEPAHIVPHNLHFLTGGTKFDTFHFQIFYLKKKKIQSEDQRKTLISNKEYVF